MKQTLGILSEHIAYPDPTVVSGATKKGHSHDAVYGTARAQPWSIIRALFYLQTLKAQYQSPSIDIHQFADPTRVYATMKKQTGMHIQYASTYPNSKYICLTHTYYKGPMSAR